jgi:putative ABC transport system permease protein
VYLTLPDAQQVFAAGLPVASAFAVTGHHLPATAPGFVFMGRAAARRDILRAIAEARRGVYLTAVILWIVAASIVGTIVYISALERQRDFAVFKATGVTSRSIVAGLALQAVVVAVAAALVGSVVATIIAPRFPVEASIQARVHLILPALAVVIGVLASLAGVRRAVTVPPALAFGGP